MTGMNTYPKQLVSAHNMRAILKHEDIEWDNECMITIEGTYVNASYNPKDIEWLLHKHKVFFENLLHGRPPDHNIDHRIELEFGTLPIKILPYKHPNKFKDDIENTIKELIYLGLIRPSSSHFASLVVLVNNKDGTLRMCIEYQDMNQKNHKEPVPNPPD